jgi:hypothetical protein
MFIDARLPRAVYRIEGAVARRWWVLVDIATVISDQKTAVEPGAPYGY